MKNAIVLGLAAMALCLFSFNTYGPKKKGNAKRALKVLNGFCNYVPSGYSIVDGDTVSVHAFYMSTSEISNFQYLEFIYDLKRQGLTERLEEAKVDTVQWINAFPDAHTKPMAQYYHNHPAYRDYPVVNISKRGAEMYCEWLTEKYKELSNGEFQPIFRLPTKAEWVRAVTPTSTSANYSWGTSRLQNEDGEYMANFAAFGPECVTRNPETGDLEINMGMYNPANDNNFFTATVDSYKPNDFGLYNMNGNVSEFIADEEIVMGGDWFSPGFDVQNTSQKNYTGAHPTIGFRVVASYLH